MLVLKFGLAPDYVLDKMEMYEINSLLKYQHYKIQENWDQARMIAFYIACSSGAKNIKKVTDIVKFQWENNDKPNKKSTKNNLETNEDIKLFDNEISRLKSKAKLIEDLINN